MKPFFLAIALCSSVALFAQNNPLLEQSFWKNNPDVAAVQAEIAKGSDAAQKNRMSNDVVVTAINAGASTEVIRFLLDQKGNEVDKLTHDGRTYIFWAAGRGNIEVVEWLVSKGAKVNLEDSHGATPLSFAAAMGQSNLQVYDALLKAGADVKFRNQEGATVLLLAIPNDKDLKLADYFVSKGLSLKDVDAAGNTAFDYAARSGNKELMNKLLEKGVKATDNAMLMAAQGTRAVSNGLDVFQYLEDLKIKPTAINKNGENALHLLARKPNQQQQIKYFISEGVDVSKADHDGNTPLMNAAASNRDTTVFVQLLPFVKNINQANKKGLTALAMAVKSNSGEVVNWFVQQGADINTKDAEGNNLAYYLLQSYNPQAAGGRGPGANAPRVDEFAAKMSVLQHAGFNLAAPQKDGNTLYHLAVAKNDLTLIKKIDKLGADINAKNSEGITALHKAAMVSTDYAILKYLLSIGASKEATTEFKETAYQLAEENETLAKNKVALDFLK